ncbi:hypothetical protein S7711_11183 [Stachybotrys chartarum IBT 7711]|uniref:Uncharacterized protein n=1 Tax=Stachybotrys chartarum (strain CBS 109288 / IBT 7711) TaxID=1280523 RepID=A0A084B7Z4_STACB|nr:hypothetical protein S7711_11183 [Stachybotrys chartarum IBT 7711]
MNDSQTPELLILRKTEINARDYQLRSPFKLALSNSALESAAVLARHKCLVSDTINSVRGIMSWPEPYPGSMELLQALAGRMNLAEQCRFVTPTIREGDVKRWSMFPELDSRPQATGKDGPPSLYHALFYDKQP